MSTRSGKKIHNNASLLEDTAASEQETAVKSERKTRSKRVKENLEDISVSIFKNKKRNNYVTYPTDDELLVDTATKKDDEINQSRILRKNALKDQNPMEIIENLDAQKAAKNLTRKSRRGKRLDDPEETENHEIVPAVVTQLPKSKKSKKKKKTIDDPPPEEAPTNKSKKKKGKGKKTNSIIIEEVLPNENTTSGALNKSTMSIDSFHSAAGSPEEIQKNINEEQDYRHNTMLNKKDHAGSIKFSSKNNKKLSSNKSFDKNDVSLNMSMDKYEYNETLTNPKESKKRKSGSNKINLSSCFVSITRYNLEEGLESINVVNQLSNEQLKGISNIKDSNTNLEEDTDTSVNVSISNKKFKTRKSNMQEINDVSRQLDMTITEDEPKNDTFEKRLTRRNSVVKDVTFDKSNASITKEVVVNIIDNVSNKYLKTRRSLVKDSTFDKSSASISVDIIDKDGGADLSDSNVFKKHPNARKSILKDSTFDKSNASITKVDENIGGVDLNVSKKQHKYRKSIGRDTTFEKSNASIVTELDIQKDIEHDLNISNISNKLRRRRSNVKDKTFDKLDNIINTTFEKDAQKGSKKDSTFDKSNSKMFNDTFENDFESASENAKDKKSNVNTTFDKTEKSNDTTFDKDSSTSFDAFKKGALTRKSSIKDTTYENTSRSITSFTKEDKNIISSSAKKRKYSRRETFDNSDTIPENVVNTTYEKTNTENVLIRKSPRLSQATSEMQTILNTTFETENPKSESKSSLISSDNSSAMEQSNISRISITSDDTTENFENIVNTTPVLIESSMDASQVSISRLESPKQQTPKKQISPKAQTPLKREGTFTKDAPEVHSETELGTPSKRKSSVPMAGCTPYHLNKSSVKKSMMNVTRSIEKGTQPSVDPTPRLTKVMFCSPVDNPVMGAQEKRKIIKSNLKGSNKSFVFDESASISRPGRKRSYTQGDADDGRAKRTRLTEDLKQSVDRLSRPRTASATGKLTVVTPKKVVTPSKPRSEGKPPRTRLPNFAALHQKQFDKMESLNECQERRAKRAKQLLTPTAPPGLLDRISPKNNVDSPKKEPAKPREKTDTPTKKLPTLESLRPGFTRFGFKLNLDVNPFSIPSKNDKPLQTEKVKEKAVELPKPNGIPPRQGVLPSLAGATSVRREVAKLTVMREKSFTDKRNLKRNENRTIIKGVRTNRRFELQMKLRNLE